MDRDLIIVGDRVLILPDNEDDRTDSGLYLPQGIKEKEKVRGGIIAKVGPGFPVPEPSAFEHESWETPRFDNKYFPLQAKEGDYCLFLRNMGIDIQYQDKNYIIAPHSAILLLLRDRLPEP